MTFIMKNKEFIELFSKDLVKFPNISTQYQQLVRLDREMTARWKNSCYQIWNLLLVYQIVIFLMTKYHIKYVRANSSVIEG